MCFQPYIEKYFCHFKYLKCLIFFTIMISFNGHLDEIIKTFVPFRNFVLRARAPGVLAIVMASKHIST